MLGHFTVNLFKAAIVCCTVIIFQGCKDEIVSEADLNNPPPAGERLAKLSSIQKNIFTPSCALSGCHTGNNPQAALNLSDGLSFSSLVNVQSILYPSFKRIDPGNSSQSLLIKVLEGEVATKMPPDGPINAAYIDSIAVWIDKGAPND